MIKTQIKKIVKANNTFLEKISVEDISQALAILKKCFTSGGKLLVCGNGGSASMSQHFVAELVGQFAGELNSLPAISLSSDIAVITALANDIGYENIFSTQISAFAHFNDVLFCLTTSGLSKNVLKAVEIAQTFKMPVIFLTGSSAPECDVVIKCGSNTQRIQEIQLVVCHLLVELLQKEI